jgi:protein SCO1/2
VSPLKLRPIALSFFVTALLLSACSGGGGEAAIGGPFHLVDQASQPRDSSILRGKWSAVFFGYTYCPDVCPTTLQALGDAQDKLGPKASRFQVVFISVDPRRDTPAQLRTYLSNSAFPKGTVGLTGSPAQIAAAAKAYHVFYQPVGSGGDYAVEHSSVVYLMNPDGRFSQVLDPRAPPAEIASRVSDAMGG